LLAQVDHNASSKAPRPTPTCKKEAMPHCGELLLQATRSKEINRLAVHYIKEEPCEVDDDIIPLWTKDTLHG